MFRRRYNLPPTDPRFLDATLEEIITDYWTHFYAENKATDEFEDEDFDLERIEEEFKRQNEKPDDWEEVKL